MYKLKDDQWNLVVDALIRLERYASEYPWVGNIDFNKACDSVYLTAAAGDAYVIDGYLVLVDVIQPWYTNDKVLQEWLVLKLIHIDGQSVDSIPPALRQLARERGCSAVITADSSPVSIVAGAYKRADFKPLTTSFYKVN